MPNDTNLTGRWSGHYYQHDRACPIAADLVQTGEDLGGSMHDTETDRTSTVFEIAFEAGLPPGADEQIVARLREVYHAAATDPISYVTHLPPDSVLEGWTRGGTVYFLKTYRGSHTGGFQIGDHVVGQEIESHAVHYRGTLRRDGTEIEGKWWIDPSPGDIGRRNEGSFVLRRQTGEAETGTETEAEAGTGAASASSAGERSETA
jgi:hypothetical protein